MQRPIFRFRNLRLDPATRQLWRGGERVALPLKSFDCLIYLIEHRDRAVGRDELIAAVWGRVEVSDKLLGQTLLRARRAIGDAGGEHAAIRTLPRFGYHWEEPVEIEMPVAAAPVTAGAPESAAAVEPSESVDEGVPARPPLAPPPPRASIPRWVVFAAVTLLLALAGLAAVHYWPKRPSAGAPQKGPLVLVLPVSGLSSGEESWIRLGAMDYLASRLRKVQGLQVLPSEQTVALLGHDGTADQRGESDLHRFEQTTGASYILAPRMAHAGSSWNATLDIYHDRGTQSFEAQAATPLQAMAQVANRFVEKIGLPAADAFEPPSSPTEYLQRIDAALLAGDLTQARTLADAAPVESKQDPAFVIRAARIAFRSGDVDKAEQLLQPLDREDAAVPAEIRAQAALGLGAAAVYRQDFAAAERRYSETIAVLGEHGAPAVLGKAHMERGVMRGVSNRFDEAMADFGRARVAFELAGDRLGGASLDTNLGLVEVFRGHYAEALAAYDRAVAAFARFGVNDNLAIALQGKIYVQRILLDLDGALASSERENALAEHLQNPLLLRRMALSRVLVLLDLGRLREAARLIERYLPDPNDPSADPVFAVFRAQLLTEQGNPVQALHGADALLDAIERQPNPGTEVYFSEAINTCVDAALRNGQPELAERWLQRLRTSRPVSQDTGRAFVLELGEARVRAARGEADVAAHFAKALAIADGGPPRDVVSAGAAYADYLVQSRTATDATAVLGRLVPYADRDYDAARAVARLYAALGNQELAGRAEAEVRRLAGERSP